MLHLLFTIVFFFFHSFSVLSALRTIPSISHFLFGDLVYMPEEQNYRSKRENIFNALDTNCQSFLGKDNKSLHSKSYV